MQMIRIARWLRDDGYADSILATDDLNGDLAALFSGEGFKVAACPLSGGGYFIKAVRELKKLITVNHIDILQAHMFRESMVCRVALAGCKGVKHIFRVETYIDCSPVSEFKKRLYHLAAMFTDSMTDVYVANGVLVSDELKSRSGVNKSKIQIVYNGVEAPGKPDHAPVSINRNGYLEIVMVANLVRGKGHEVLFEAIACLKNKGIYVHATCVGDEMEQRVPGVPGYRDELTNLITSLGINDMVYFYGFSRDMTNLLSKFRVVVLPSYSEATPNTILEAMSTRKLVIASDVGELPYMVIHEQTGLLHKSGDAAGLATLLERVAGKASEEFDAMRDAGYERWKNLFSLHGMMERLKYIYSNQDKNHET